MFLSKRVLRPLALVIACIELTSAVPCGQAPNGQGCNECGKGLYPDIADSSHASPEARKLFDDYFITKSVHDPNGFLKTWNPKEAEYLDSTLGYTIAANRSALVASQEYVMAKWNKTAPNDRSYPLRVLGDTVGGAIVYFVDTPGLFGAEIRTLSSFDFLDGKIRRQLDNWNARDNKAKGIGADPQYPHSLGLEGIPESAAPEMRRVAYAIQKAFSIGDASAAGKLFSYDAVFEDLTLSARIEGRIAITAYLQRAISKLPYGPGATVTHVLGNTVGGGYEWRPSGNTVRYGAAALELDCSGNVTHFTAVWDGSRVNSTEIEGLSKLTPSP